MPEITETPIRPNTPSMFIDGYFSKRIDNGETPDYGYPKNHLPAVREGASMEVVSGFLAAVVQA